MKPNDYPFEVLIGPEHTDRLLAITSDIAPRLDYRLVAERCQANIRQWRPPPSGLRGARPVRVARSLFGNLRHAAGLIRSLPSGAVVYTTGETWGLPMGLAGMAPQQRRFKHIVYVHRVFSPAWLRFLHTTRNWLAVDGWICVTQHQARLLRSALVSSGAPVAVVSQGVDTRFFDPEKAAAPQQPPYLLSVGVEMRNYDLLFEAVRSLDIDVVVKASSTWMAGGRSQLTSIPPNVRVITERLSYVELRDLYAGAALVVVPLYDTAQAAGITTILEGMAMGKCILATQSSGLPDVLVDRRTGWVAPATVPDLRQAIAALCNDPGARQELALTGQQAVCAGFTLEHHADAIVEFLKTVVENG